MRRSCLLFAAAGLAVAGLTTGACGTAPDDSAATDTEISRTVTGGEPFHGLLEYRAKDAKLALVKPTLVSVTQAPLATGVSVVGVTAGGETRAYPLYILKNHQIVNDRVGGMPIAASW